MKLAKKILLFLLVPVVVVAAYAVTYIVRTYDASVQTRQVVEADTDTNEGEDATQTGDTTPAVTHGTNGTTAEPVTIIPFDEQLASSEPIAANGRFVNPSQPMVALTFDDGPRENFTEQILDILQEHDVVATFFLIGQQVERNSDTVLRAYQMGNEIGNHSWSHVYLTRRSADSIRTQIRSTSDAIDAITGEKPKLMRPPYGDFNDSVATVIAEFELPAIFWSIDPSDYRDITPETIFDRVMNNVQDGSVILLHDTQERTVEATSKLIPALLNEGYQLVTVSELFHYKGVDPAPGEAYRNKTFTSPPFHGEDQ